MTNLNSVKTYRIGETWFLECIQLRIYIYIKNELEARHSIRFMFSSRFVCNSLSSTFVTYEILNPWY